jgi:hypothetical protein
VLHRRRWPLLALVLLGGCSTVPTRRPTAEELAEWQAHADRVVVCTVLWEVAAAAALALCIWVFVRYFRGTPPPWPPSATILIAISTALMLWPTFVFAGLWSA